MSFVKKIRDFAKYTGSQKLFSYSAQVAFYFILALFPFLYLIIRLAALFSISNEAIMDMLYYMFPGQSYGIVLYELESLSGESWQAFVTCIIGIWSASMIVTTVKNAIRRGHKEHVKRNFIINRIISLLATILFGIGILISIVAMITLNVVAGFIADFLNLGYFSEFLTVILAGVIFLVDLVITYMIAPAKRIKISEALPGAAVAEILFLAGAVLFSFYVGEIADYSIVYGALGGVIVLIIWLYICSFILILGGHINNYLRLKNWQNAE